VSAPAAAPAGPLRRITGGAAAAPLMVLFGLNLVDEFDRVAFGVLSPEIRDAFGLSDSGVVGVAAVAAFTALAAALPIGWLADRTNRVRLSGAAALLWAGMAVLTGLAPALAVLVVARIGAGVGRITNEPVHASLLTDLYPPETHPRVFAVHRLANPVGLSGALLVGVLADLLGWRAVFFLVALPTVLLVGTLALVREPLRGGSVDAGLAQEAAAAEPVPFGEARRQLFAVRSLRRMWVAIFVLGVGALTLPQLVSLFFEQTFGFGPQGRGLATFLSGVGTVIGLAVGQHVASRELRAGRPSRLAVNYGWAFVVLGGGLALMAVSPWAWLALLFNLVAGIGIGAYQPNYFPLVGLVSPARVRSQAFAWAILWLGAGGLLSPSIADIGESAGYRVAIVVLSGALVLGGVVARSAAATVDRDIAQATANLATAARLRTTMEEKGEQALLVCSQLDVAYDGVQVLFGVDLEVQQGECLALLGTNGAGKSTVLRAVSGLVDPVGGSIFFDGRDITHADAVQTARMGIVQMPGGKGCFPTLTVAEHFQAAGWLYGKEAERVAEAMEEVLRRFPRLRERWGSQAGDMSGGEQQQLALSMAFIASPRLLLIDELSLGLAPTVVENLLDLVREIHAAGTTVVIVEQSVNVALTLAQRAVFLEKGEVRFSGPTAELLERTDVLRAVYLQGAAAGLGAARTEDRAEPRTEVDRDDAPALSVSGLRRRYGGITAVDDVSFDVWPGEVLGFIGPNGAGKTTVFDLVCGFTPTEAGHVVLEGCDVTSWSPDRRALAGLGRSFQDARIFPALTVSENLALSLERHLEVRDHLASTLGLPAAREVEDDVDYTVDDLVELMRLGAFRDKRAGELSTGSRRIVDLAMALAHDPTVLVLDEPSSGIAQKEAEALGPLLLRLRDETGCALLVVEHDMPLITSVSDRLVAMVQGRVAVTGDPQAVVTDPLVVSSYLGGDVAALNRSGSAAVPPSAGASR